MSGTPHARLGRPARRGLLVAAGAAALAAGASWQWWRSHQADNSSPTGLESLWALELPTPAGPTLALRAFRGRPLLLNFWAAWCKPCITEMPELDRFAQAWGPRGGQVLGLAIDQAEPVQRFLAHTPVSFPIALAGTAGLKLVRDLGNTAGGLPFTVLISAEGQIVRRKLGASTLAELQAWTPTPLKP